MSSKLVLAAILLILALMGALVGSPGRITLDVSSIARLIEAEEDHISPTALAEQLYGGRRIRLIDLRDSASYAEQHIPGAERVPLESLLKGALRQNEVTVLYSEGGTHASQAWVLLKLMRHDSVFTLLGGFAGWKREVLDPILGKETNPEERIANERRRALSIFFGGKPRKEFQSATGKGASQKRGPARKPTPPATKPEGDRPPLRYVC